VFQIPHLPEYLVDGYPRASAVVWEILVDRGFRISKSGLPVRQSDVDRKARESRKSGMSQTEVEIDRWSRASNTDQWTITGTNTVVIRAMWILVASTDYPIPPSWADFIKFEWNPVEEVNQAAGRLNGAVTSIGAWATYMKWDPDTLIPLSRDPTMCLSRL
jgi:hypothetical protein